MSWLIFLIISVCFGAVTRLAQRVLLGKDQSDPIAFAIAFQGLTGLVIIGYALFTGFSFPNFEKYWPAAISSIFLFAMANIALAKSLQRVEASIFTVLLATSVVWIMLLSIIFFDESLSIWRIAGTILTFLSILLLVERKGKFEFDQGVWYGLLAGILMGSAIIGWVYVGRRSDPISWQAICFIAPAAICALLNPRSLAKTSTLLSGPRFIKLLLASVTFAISSLALLYAYKHGQITQVAPLSQTSIIVTVILAVIFLNERKRLLRKIISALICFAGVLMIVG